MESKKARERETESEREREREYNKHFNKINVSKLVNKRIQMQGYYFIINPEER